MNPVGNLRAIEVHAEGEPGRVIIDGIGSIPGASVFEQMQYLQNHNDIIRTTMLREPRGYPALCCNILVPAKHPKADIGLIIMEQSEYAPMSGSNMICTTTVILETGILPMMEPETRICVETPAGLVDVTATCINGKVTRVRFQNVPAFAMHLDVPLEVPGLGQITVDIAWGGMFFVLADADKLNISLDANNGRTLCRVSETIRHAATQQWPVAHPDNPELQGPTITNLYGAPNDENTHGRGAITLSTGTFDSNRPDLASGILDRSPCGTGTCAKMAVLHAKGLLSSHSNYVNAGPLGTTFTGHITGTTKIGQYPAIETTLSGQAWIYGRTDYSVAPTDPFPNGFRVSDIW